MRRIGLAFLFIAALNAVVGVSLGVGMGIAHDFTLAPVHAHLNLVGWVSLALFGLAYRSWPELGAARLARWHFAVAAPASMLFPFGLFLAIVHQAPALAIATSLAWLAGALMFAVGVGRGLFASAPDQARERVSQPAR